MGRSQTYHVIGQTAIIKEGGRESRRVYPAMNRVEMEQKRLEASKDGHPITSWRSQTKTGERVLGCGVWGFIVEADAPHVRMITCPICRGVGHNGEYHCPVCDGSGICKPGNEKHWQQWQLDKMRAENEAVEPVIKEPESLLGGLAQSLANKLGKPIAIEPAGIHAEPVTKS